MSDFNGTDIRENPNILFIAGPGRSGSTLLDLLLGQIDGFCSTGELRFIWNRGFAQNQLCGCGQPFRECEFWVKVVKQAFGRFESVDHGRLEELRLSAEHRVSNGLFPGETASRLSPYSEYFDAYNSLYGAIQKVAGCRFIVDSSKNIANGFLLSGIPGINLYTVHLLRDSRAVAYSWQREKVRPEIHWERKLMSQRSIFKSATRWNSRNRFAHALRHVSKQYTRLHYEDLVSDPKDRLTTLLADLGIMPASFDFLTDHRAVLKTSHTVSGNPVRFAQQEIEIQPDMHWQQAMPKSQKWLVTLMTLPLMMKYGYFKNHQNGHRVNYHEVAREE